MKKLFLLLIILPITLSIGACSTVSFKTMFTSPDKYDELALGQDVKGTLLEGMGDKVGLADARAAYTVLENCNTFKSWKSVYGARISIRPSIAQISNKNHKWCREVTIVAGKHKKVIALCKNNLNKWTKM